MRTSTVALITILLVALAVAEVASAQGTMIPIPAFTRTFSSSLTRGFYFQAPIAFTVIGLRVPDESKHGKQNVVLFNESAAPPAWSSTQNMTPKFTKFNEPSANIIPCSVSFKKDDWLVVLGACGDTTTMRNSYGTPAGCFGSNVLGNKISICRCGTQFNIISKAPPYPVWSENGGNVSRVEVYVGSAQLTGSGTGAPGTPVKLALSSPADANFRYQIGSSLGNGPIPIDTRQLGLSADALLALSAGGLLPSVFSQYSGTLDGSGMGSATLNIPPFPILKGVRIHTAFVTLNAPSPSGVASISNTFLLTIS